MPIGARHNGAWRTPNGVLVRAGGSWRRAGWVYARQNGAWRLVFEDLFNFNITGNLTDVNLRNAAVSAGWDGVRRVVATVTSGSVLNGSSSSTPALRINGSFPRGVILLNYGTIAGRGGNGGAGGAGRGDIGVDNTNGIYGTAYGGATGGQGGPGLIADVPVSVFNYGIIAGGGGGGGGGGSTIANSISSDTGGGGGK